MNRRAALMLAAAGAGLWLAAPQIAKRVSGRFEFEALDDPPGFRRLATGRPTGAPNPFIGIDLPTEQQRPQAAAPSDFCTALHGPRVSGTVPIAFFTDYNCPYCRVLKARIAELQTRKGVPVSVTWHEWPLLGPTSTIVAQAALAADQQGAHDVFQKRLGSGRFVPTPAFLEELARDIGIDAAQMQADMQSTEVSTRLGETDAIARRFGLIGTPGLVVGRTVVVGSLSSRMLRALVAREHSDGPIALCTA